MTTITSIILSVLMGVSQNLPAAHTGISSIQCSSGFSTIAKKNIAKFAKFAARRSNPWVNGIMTAAEIGWGLKDYLFDDSGEDSKAGKKERKVKGHKKAKPACGQRCKQKNWHKDFQPKK